MREFDFIFYRDTEQGNGDWHETLSVINFTRTPPQKQVMLDAYGKARTVNESGFKGRNAASAAAAAAENRLLAENIRRLVCRMTAFATEFALYGNLWQQWITYMIMMHENAFTMACERRTVSSSSTIMKLAERDFGLFRELMNLDLDAFGKETGTADFAAAREYVDRNKQDRIRMTASMYLSMNPTKLQPRFDVIEIYAPQGDSNAQPVINHMEDAFQ